VRSIDFLPGRAGIYDVEDLDVLALFRHSGDSIRLLCMRDIDDRSRIGNL